MKLKDIIRYAKMRDVTIRDWRNEVIIFLKTTTKRYELTKEEIEKLMEELDKRGIGYDLCDGCGACGY